MDGPVMEVIDRDVTTARRTANRSLLRAAGWDLVGYLLVCPLMAMVSVVIGARLGVWAGIGLYLSFTASRVLLSLLTSLDAVRRTPGSVLIAAVEVVAAASTHTRSNPDERRGGGSR